MEVIVINSYKFQIDENTTNNFKMTRVQKGSKVDCVDVSVTDKDFMLLSRTPQHINVMFKRIHTFLFNF